MKNQCHIIAEVTGSSPVPPTIASVLGQDLPLSVVLEACWRHSFIRSPFGQLLLKESPVVLPQGHCH